MSHPQDPGPDSPSETRRADHGQSQQTDAAPNPSPGGSAEGAADPAAPDPWSAADPDGTDFDDPGLDAMRAELDSLRGELAQAHDRHLRAVAEMENVRRRAAEDVAKAHKFSIEGFAESLLPVKDSLEMALKVDAPSIESLREGVEATLRQLTNAFERNKLLEIDPVGQKFDPHQHQAISMVPGASQNPPVPAQHVVMVLQKGYLINERVLRPALVTVSQG